MLRNCPSVGAGASSRIRASSSLGVKGTMIQDTLAGLPGRAYLFLDTCHSGGAMKGVRTRSAGPSIDIDGLVNELTSAERGVITFSSSTGRQLSQESEEWGNGAFTKALVEALGGGAARPDSPRITVSMVEGYIAERVKALTNGGQTPTTTRPPDTPDLPLALRR